jgi:hypothetical protein
LHLYSGFSNCHNIQKRQKEEADHIEDTQRLVTEIEMLKVVLSLCVEKIEEEEEKNKEK